MFEGIILSFSYFAKGIIALFINTDPEDGGDVDHV